MSKRQEIVDFCPAGQIINLLLASAVLQTVPCFAKIKNTAPEQKLSFCSFTTMNKRQETVDFCPTGQGTNCKFAPAGAPCGKK